MQSRNFGQGTAGFQGREQVGKRDLALAFDHEVHFRQAAQGLLPERAEMGAAADRCDGTVDTLDDFGKTRGLQAVVVHRRDADSLGRKVANGAFERAARPRFPLGLALALQIQIHNSNDVLLVLQP